MYFECHMRVCSPRWLAFLATAVIHVSILGNCSELTCSSLGCGRLPDLVQRQLIQKTVFQPATVKASEEPAQDGYFQAADLDFSEPKVNEKDLLGLATPGQSPSSELSSILPQLGLAENSLESLPYDSEDEAVHESMLPIRLPQIDDRALEDVRRPGWHSEASAFSDLPVFDGVGDASRIALLQGVPVRDQGSPGYASRGDVELPEIPDGVGEDFSGSLKTTANARSSSARSSHGQRASANSVNLAYKSQDRDTTLQGVVDDDECGESVKVKCSGPNKVLTFDYKVSVAQGIFMWIAILLVMCCVAPIIRCIFETAAMVMCLLQVGCVLAFLALVAIIYFKATNK